MASCLLFIFLVDPFFLFFFWEQWKCRENWIVMVSLIATRREKIQKSVI